MGGGNECVTYTHGMGKLMDGGDYGTTMALGYAWFDSYDSVGYVLTLHISPIQTAHTSP